MVWTLRSRQAFDLVMEEPSGTDASRRLQRFAGFVQSDRPLPPFRVLLDKSEQRVSRTDLGDPLAPRDRRYTAYWNFHLELPSAPRRLELELFVDRRRIGHRVFDRGPPDDRRDRPLVLLSHIPKTAGSSLRNALEMQTTIRLLRLYDNPQFMPLAQRATLTPAAFDDLDVVFGHFVYGCHKFTHRDYRYVTLLRTPTEVLKSTYLFFKYVVRKEPFESYASIEEALAAARAPLANLQTRFVAGKTSPEPVDADDLARALANMERDYAYAGTVEDMATSLAVIGDYLGVPLDHYTVNATPPSVEAETITTEDLTERLGRYVEHDLRLYERACELFKSGARA